MENKNLPLRFGIITGLIIVAILSRLIPHPQNLTPIGGISLFGAAYYSKRYWAFLIPILSMWLSDLLINNILYTHYFDSFVWFYPGAWFTYGAFAIIIAVGYLLLKTVSIKNLLWASIFASIAFFLISNFGVWLSSGMYAPSVNGLLNCYLAGIPFLQNTLIGDFVYTGLLFGTFEMAQRQIPQIKLNATPKHI